MSEFSYAALTTAERWDWHAEVYAFRRICLHAPHSEHTSPCDPDGKFFDEERTAAAMRRLNAKLQARRGA